MRKLFYSVLIIIVLTTIWGYAPDKSLESLKGKYAPPPSQFILVDGIQVHYRDEGIAANRDSTPLILLHGTSSSLHTWSSWVTELSSDFRIIRLDLPDFGLTGSDGHTLFNGPEYATFVAHFLDQLGISNCYMAGNSLGGEVCWQMARLYPNRVKKMILIDAAGIPFQSSGTPIGFKIAGIPVLREFVRFITPYSLVEKSIKNEYADPSKVTTALVDQYYDMTLRAGNRDALIRKIASKSTSYNNHFDELPNIQTPTMILWGAQDKHIPVALAYAFQKALPNDTLVIIPTAGHLPMEETGSVTAKIVRDYLNRLSIITPPTINNMPK
jgi:pimeloyl-ACP methyl ester carboxylesterase